MKRKCFYYLIFSLAVSFGVQGQIIGVINDQSSGTPIEYATIILKKGNEVIEGTISKPDGSFIMPVNDSGIFSIEISFLGYQTKEVNSLDLKKNRPLDLGKINIESSRDQLEEVVVETNQATFRNKIDRQVFSADAFSAAKGGTGVDLIRNLPSVTFNGLGEISVRGSSGFVVLVNNKPLQSDVVSFLNQIPANSIKNIEIITTPSAQYDAEGKAGIINILTQKNALKGDYLQVNTLMGAPSIEDYQNAQSAQRFGADLTYNTVSARWNVSSGFNFQRNDISGRREGDVYTLIGDKYTRFPSDGERSFDEVNFSGRLTADYKISDRDEFSVGFYAGKRTKDRTADIVYYNNYAITDAIDYQFQYYNENLRIRKSDFALGSIDYNHLFTNEAKLSTSFLYEYTLLGGPTTNRNLGHPDHSVVYQDEHNTNDNPRYGVRFNIDYEFKPLRLGTLKMGYQFRNLDHKGDFVYERKNNITQRFELVPEFSSEVNLKRSIHAAYFQFQRRFKKWNYTGGIRLESMDRDLYLKDKTGQVDEKYSLNFNKLFPSASINYQWKDNISLGLSYSKRIDRTTTFKMNPFPEREHSETLEQGDPQLHPELTDQVEFGVSYKTKKGNQLNSSLYYRNTDHLINRVNTVYNDTILNRIYSNVGKAQVLGREFNAEYAFGKKFKIFSSMNTYYFKLKGSFDDLPIDTSGYVYNLNINSTYRFSNRVFAQFNLNYVSRRLTAQGEDSEFYSPNLTLTHRFWNDQLTATLQWKNIDMGLMNTNEQRITTYRKESFYTTTNYVYEVDVVLLSLSFNLNNRKSRAKFIDSEFGKREF